MKIGTIGSGNLGRTLGLVLAERGHDVLFGARDVGQARAAAAYAPDRVWHGTNDEAAAFGDVILWTVRGVPPAEVIAHTASLDGKVVLDPNNGPVPDDYRLGPVGPSYAEELARALPRARVVKAFNTAAQEIYEHEPEVLRHVSGFLAGDDPDAKHIAATLVRDIGLTPVDAGPLAAARMLEGVADFIRRLMGSFGVYATVSVQTLPSATMQRRGGRAPTRLA